MFNSVPKPHDVALDEVIADLLKELNGMKSSDENYTAAAKHLDTLMRLRKDTNSSWRPSPDAVLGAGASIAGIFAILYFEKAGVVTSKALGFIGKLK